jgi:hypothetical protein
MLLKGTPVQALERVLQELLTLVTAGVLGRVMRTTVEADHGLYCLSFARHAAAEAG